jgi:NADP-dependent 3-hydroxy acid dehydrogenase YdfG
MLLQKKTAVISGAASPRGIGFATARLFAEHGARVAILDLDETGAKRAAQELGNAHIGIGCNVAERESCQAGRTRSSPVLLLILPPSWRGSTKVRSPTRVVSPGRPPAISR